MSILKALAGLAVTLSTAAALAQPCCDSRALLADLQYLRSQIARVHPQPEATADLTALARTYADLEAEFAQGSHSPQQAWLKLARLNPLFNDAHLQIGPASRREQVLAHLKAGGSLFPYEVQVDERGELRIRAELGGAPSPLAGARIDVINGRSAVSVARELLTLTPGDTPAFRANVLSTRWYYPFWMRFGAPTHFDLQVDQGGVSRRLQVAASKQVPSGAQDERFEDVFRFELLPRDAALLTINAFEWGDKPRFLAWMEANFEKIRQAGVKHLIIDLRANGGGNDDLWKDGLLPYIADKPYRHGSSYLKKVIEGRASGSEKVGDIVPGQVEGWVQPMLEHPLRFRGKVWVLTGRMTYSSSVLLSNVMQDFGFGQLVGSASYVRSRQTGGVQMISLPHSKLVLIVPRFVLTRPSGQSEPVLLTPDLLLPDSPFDEREQVNALLARL